MSEIKVNSVVNSTGDNDSGLDLSTNDTIKFKIANAQKAIIDSSGNVGIGNISPTARLHIKNASNDYTTSLLYLQGGSGTNRTFKITPSVGGLRVGSANNSTWSLDTDGYENIRFSKSSDMRFFANNLEKMRLLANGNLGIGVTSPSNKLEVSGTLKATGAVNFTDDLVVDGNFEVGTETQFYDTVNFNGSDVNLTQSSVTGLDVSVVPSKTVVLQSSALNGYQDANDSTEDLYWSTMSTHNTSHITWSAGQGGYYFQFVTGGEYMIYCTLAVTNSQSNDRLNFLAYVTHMSGTNQPIYSYGIGGSYIRDDNSPYDSGGLGGGVRLFVNAGERVKINTELLDTETPTGSAFFDTTKSKIRIEKITYSTT